MPRAERAPEIRYQPSVLSVPSTASTVAPETPSQSGAQQTTSPVLRRKLWFFVAVGAIGAIASQAIGESVQVAPQIHHGSPGYRQSRTGKNQLWHRRSVTVYVDASLTKVDAAAADAVHRAFGHWVESHEGLPALTFDTGKTSTTPKQDGKSTVSYGPIAIAGHERDLAVTLTYSDERTGEIVEADIMLNSAYPLGVLNALEQNWKRDGGRPRAGGSSKSMFADEAQDCRDRYDVQNVVTHEVGHFFGLGEDMTEQGATMFKSIDECETHKRVLASTDSHAIGQLYSAMEEPEADAKGARGCSVAVAPTNAAPLWPSLLLLGLLARRRRR